MAARCLRRRADLLITDLRLPGGSGFDVVALARRRFGQLPVLPDGSLRLAATAQDRL